VDVHQVEIFCVKNDIKMAPVPLEGHQTPVTNNIPQEGNRGGSISLGMLIDFIIQRTYHELTVLAELYVQKIWNIIHFNIDKIYSVSLTCLV